MEAPISLAATHARHTSASGRNYRSLYSDYRHEVPSGSQSGPEDFSSTRHHRSTSYQSSLTCSVSRACEHRVCPDVFWFPTVSTDLSESLASFDVSHPAQNRHHHVRVLCAPSHKATDLTKGSEPPASGGSMLTVRAIRNPLNKREDQGFLEPHPPHVQLSTSGRCHYAHVTASFDVSHPMPSICRNHPRTPSVVRLREVVEEMHKFPSWDFHYHNMLNLSSQSFCAFQDKCLSVDAIQRYRGILTTDTIDRWAAKTETEKKIRSNSNRNTSSKASSVGAEVATTNTWATNTSSRRGHSHHEMYLLGEPTSIALDDDSEDVDGSATIHDKQPCYVWYHRSCSGADAGSVIVDRLMSKYDDNVFFRDKPQPINAKNRLSSPQTEHSKCSSECPTSFADILRRLDGKRDHSHSDHAAQRLKLDQLSTFNGISMDGLNLLNDEQIIELSCILEQSVFESVYRRVGARSFTHDRAHRFVIAFLGGAIFERLRMKSFFDAEGDVMATRLLPPGTPQEIRRREFVLAAVEELGPGAIEFTENLSEHDEIRLFIEMYRLRQDISNRRKRDGDSIPCDLYGDRLHDEIKFRRHHRGQIPKTHSQSNYQTGESHFHPSPYYHRPSRLRFSKALKKIK